MTEMDKQLAGELEDTELEQVAGGVSSRSRMPNEWRMQSIERGTASEMTGEHRRSSTTRNTRAKKSAASYPGMATATGTKAAAPSRPSHRGR